MKSSSSTLTEKTENSRDRRRKKRDKKKKEEEEKEERNSEVLPDRIDLNWINNEKDLEDILMYDEDTIVNFPL